jgi:hypothetical protein
MSRLLPCRPCNRRSARRKNPTDWPADIIANTLSFNGASERFGLVATRTPAESRHGGSYVLESDER